MDITDEQLLELLADRPRYKALDLCDAEFSQLITMKGHETYGYRRQSQIKVMGISVLVGGLVGLGSVLVNSPISPEMAFSLLALYFLFGYSVGVKRAHAVKNAFRIRRYDIAARLLPEAVWWNVLWYPFTMTPLTFCLTMQMRMLLLEGRIFELEAYTRFLMTYVKPEQRSKWLPLNNNIWLSWMLGGRYAEAADAFGACDLDAISKPVRAIILNNLAWCQVNCGQVEQAQDTLKRAFAEVASQPETIATARLEFIQANGYLEQRDLSNAEASIDEAMQLATKFSDLELQAECMVLRGRILRAQKRFDESKLHFQNAIEIFCGTDNTQYLSLCSAMHFYAQMLLESGDTESALKVMRRVLEYNENYQQREERTFERIKQRLQQTTKIRTGSDLLTFSAREHLIELSTAFS
jgi:tetratricopeptide (TPR) repeat protein